MILTQKGVSVNVSWESALKETGLMTVYQWCQPGALDYLQFSWRACLTRCTVVFELLYVEYYEGVYLPDELYRTLGNTNPGFYIWQ